MRSISFMLATLLLLGAALAAPAADTGSVATPGEGLAAALGGSWLVRITGEKRTRTLTVFGLVPMGFGAAGSTTTLDGTYGFSDGTPLPVRISASGGLEDAEIAFTSSARAKIRARMVSPAELRGTFEFKGETRPVSITRAPVTATARRDSKITFVYIGAFN